VLCVVLLCWSTGKFSESHRQPVSSLSAVEETHRAGFTSMRAEPARTVMQTTSGRINAVEPSYVPGLDLGYAENQMKTSEVANDYSTSAGTPRKEFGTQTGTFTCVLWWLIMIMMMLHCMSPLLHPSPFFVLVFNAIFFLFLILISDSLHFSLVQCLRSDFVISDTIIVVVITLDHGDDGGAGRTGFNGGPGSPGPRPPTNRGPPTKHFISYFSLNQRSW